MDWQGNINISWGPEENKQDHATDGQVNNQSLMIMKCN